MSKMEIATLIMLSISTLLSVYHAWQIKRIKRRKHQEWLRTEMGQNYTALVEKWKQERRGKF